MEKRREASIRYIVPTLRNRWKEELAPFPDDKIAELYESFSMSDDYGNNDEKFPEWFDILKDE